jgi:hypothetical protein
VFVASPDGSENPFSKTLSFQNPDRVEKDCSEQQEQ